MAIVEADYALVRRLSRRDEGALAELMRRHQDRLYRLALRLLRQPQEAEDALQEVFLKVYQHADRFQPTGTVAAWLNRITANHCLNLLRARRSRREVSWDDLEGESGPASFLPDPAGVDPLAHLTGRECAAQIQAALEALPEKQRQALVLKRFGDFSYQEIGALMGLSSQAVDGLIKRARQTLRQKLAAYLEPAG